MTDTGWTIDAIAAHLNVDRSVVQRMLDAGKAFTFERAVALPDDLEERFYAIRAERLGAIVVQPLSGLDAQKAFVAGLVGLMAAAQLPEKADAMVKATLRPTPAKAGLRR